MTEDRRSLMLSAVLISLLAAALLLLTRSQGLLQPIELAGYDLGLTLRPSSPAPSPVTLIEFTEADIQALGRWPVTDDQLRQTIEQIDAFGPRVVGLDIYRDVAVPPGTDELHSLFAANRRLIGILKFHTESSVGVDPPASLESGNRIGFSDMVLDADGVVRRGLAFLDDGDNLFWAFSLKLALAYLAAEGIAIRPDADQPQHFRLGPTLIPPIPERFGAYHRIDNAGYQYLIDHRQRPENLPTYTLADLDASRIPSSAITDRIVILGVNAESVKDSFVTPISRWSLSGDPQVPGITLHGLLTDQLIRASRGESSPMQAPGALTEVVLLVFACLAGGAAGLLSRSVARLALIAVTGIVGVTALGIVLFVQDYWLPVFPMAAGWTASAGLVTAYLVQRARRERHQLQQILNVQISPAVASEIWRQRDELLSAGKLKPQTLTATVMFVDLQGFTQQTERRSPESLLDWLTPFLEIATETILEHGGMVDDYFGDGVKANFGVPKLPGTEADIAADAKRAVSCARAMTRRLASASRDLEAPYVVRFGIHTGEVLAGTVGSRFRSKYTTIGDTVNVAARLETTAKELALADMPTRNRIVASETTVSLAGNGDTWHKLGAIPLKGRNERVTAYVLHLEDLEWQSEQGVLNRIGGHP